MKLKYKYAIGTHIMFYEVELLNIYSQGIENAVKEVDEEDRKNITFDFVFNMMEHFEKIDYSEEDDIDGYMYRKFTEFKNHIESLGVNVEYKVLSEHQEGPYNIADYRRDFNDKYCDKADYIIWGETDALFPEQTFDVLEKIKNWTIGDNIHKYIVTFATRKMWDATWAPLEFSEFADEEYYENDNPLAHTAPHSIRYSMGVEEMNYYNNKCSEYDIHSINKPKFDGSLLVISSDLIKSGINIPKGVIGLSGEDEAFIYACSKELKNNYIQFIVKNIMKVHNREHSKKRFYAVAKDTGKKTVQSDKGNYYDTIRKMSKHNVYNYAFSKQDKFITYAEMMKKANELHYIKEDK